MASMIAILAVICIAVVGSSGAGSNLRTTNMDGLYGKWTKTSIPFYIDSDYSMAEANMIRSAIGNIQTDLNFCVAFTEVLPSNPAYKIKFTALTGAAGSAPQQYCYAYPGVVKSAVAAGQTEQIISIARGASGCMDGTLHSIMRYIAITLGKRPEHQRGDRNNFITYNSANVAAPLQTYYTPLSSGQAYWSLFGYDLCSITHAQPGDMANPSSAAFTVPAATLPGFVPKLDHLSLTDCKLLSMVYACDSTACTQSPCASMASTTTGGTTTTGSTTTNTGTTSTGPTTTTNTGTTSTSPTTTSSTTSTSTTTRTTSCG